MKIFRSAAVVGFLLASFAPAAAQWQVQNHSLPIGRGVGVMGFGSLLPPTTGGIPLVSSGGLTDPSFGSVQNVGIQPGAANTYKGSVNGSATADITMPSCTGVSQALQYNNGTGPSCGNIQSVTGFDMPTNMGLSSSATGGALTVTLTTAAGVAPTTASPIIALFRSTAAFATGTPVQTIINATVSATIPSGATLGTANSVPFRIWIFLAYNNGTPELAFAVCSNSSSAAGTSNVFPCASWEYTLKTTTVLNTSANSSGVLYTPTANTLDAVRIIGFCDYTGGLVTAGTWASACNLVQLFGPGIKKPGDTVQVVSAQQSTSLSITPSSAINITKIAVYGTLTGASAALQVKRGATSIGNPVSLAVSAGATVPGAVIIYDGPETTSATSYSYTGAGGGSGGIMVEEIMGALEPANDNQPLEMTG